ncbi:bax inhibitor 1 [Diutina catenulata]
MSYSPLDPPRYSEESPRPSTSVSGDPLADDFKYSVNVAGCELAVRQMFIRKVYALLTMQIMGTVVVGWLIRSNEALQSWCMNNMWLYFVSILGTFGFLIATMVKAKSYPWNLGLLAGFTICESYGIGLMCSFIESDVVAQALLLTLVIFIGLTLFAFQTKYDFTQWQGVLGMSLWALIAMGFVMWFVPSSSSTVQLAYGVVGALIFAAYIVVDTQSIMKTAHLDDEIVSCIQLYLDMVNLFLFILRILQSQQND